MSAPQLIDAKQAATALQLQLVANNVLPNQANVAATISGLTIGGC